MGRRVGWDEENLPGQNQTDFSKLRMAAGDFARVILGLEDPWMGFVHNLRKPKILNGRPVYETLTNKSTGQSTQEIVRDFVSAPLCLGDEGTLAERGADPQHCPACAAAVGSDMVEAPRAKYAMNIIRYGTKPGGTELALPFGVSCLVWSFSAKPFSRIQAIAKEVAANGEKLFQHDILFGPVTNPNFQQFDIAVSMTAEWLKAGDERKAMVVETFKSQRTDDLMPVIGRRMNRQWMEDTIEQIHEAWQVVNAPVGAFAVPQYGQQQPQQQYANQVAAMPGLEGLLDGLNGQQPVPAPVQYEQPAAAAYAPPMQPQQPAPSDPWAAVGGLPQQPADNWPTAPAPQQQPMVPQVTMPSLEEIAAPVPQQQPQYQEVQPPVPQQAPPAQPAPTTFEDLLKGLN